MWACNYICVSLCDKFGGDCGSCVCFISLTLSNKAKLCSQTIQYQDLFQVVMWRVMCEIVCAWCCIIPRQTNLVACI